MSEKAKSGANIAKFILLNAIGIFMFFITIQIGETKSIPVDFVVTKIRSIPYFELVYCSLIVAVGAVLPFIRKTWNKDKVTMVFSFLKLLAIPVLILWLTKTAARSFMDEHAAGIITANYDRIFGEPKEG